MGAVLGVIGAAGAAIAGAIGGYLVESAAYTILSIGEWIGWIYLNSTLESLPLAALASLDAGAITAFYAAPAGATYFWTSAGLNSLASLGLIAVSAATGAILGVTTPEFSVNDKTDTLASGNQIFLNSSINDYVYGKECSFTDSIVNDDCLRFNVRNQRVKKMRLSNRRKRNSSVQSTVPKSVHEDMEWSLEAGQPKPTKARKVVVKTGRLR